MRGDVKKMRILVPKIWKDKKLKALLCNELKIAYEEAVKVVTEKGYLQKEMQKGLSKNEAILKLISNFSYTEEEISHSSFDQMKSGAIKPNYMFLSFIAYFAGEKYDYTFLAAEPRKDSAITKIGIAEDGYIYLNVGRGGRYKKGKPFPYDEITSELIFAWFCCFLSQKDEGLIDRDMLFYDYQQSEFKRVMAEKGYIFSEEYDLREKIFDNLIDIEEGEDISYKLEDVLEESEQIIIYIIIEE